MSKKCKEIFSQGKLYWIFVTIVAVLCYGFALTHSSVGVDDEVYSFYYEGGWMFQQGRWSGPLLNLFLNWAEYLPFWREFLGMLLLITGATLFVFVFDQASGGRIKCWTAAAFAGTLISFPLISNLFIFSNACVCGINMIAAAMACLCLEQAIESPRKIQYYIITLLLLTYAAEYGITFFLNGYCIIWFLRYAFMEEKSKVEIRRFFLGMFTAAGLAAAAYALNHLIGRIVQQIYFGQAYPFYSTSAYIAYDKSNSFLIQLAKFIGLFLKQMVTQATSSTAAFAFFAATVILLGGSIWIAIKEKKPLLLLIGLSVFVSAIAMSIVSGNLFLPKRTQWTYSLYVAFTASLLCYFCGRKTVLKGLSCAAICLLIFYQTKESNHLFFADYQRYQADLYNANALAADIIATAKERGTNYYLHDQPELAKPVIFIGIPTPYSIDHCRDEVVGWSIVSFDSLNEELSATRLFAFMKMHGHWFEKATNYDPNIVREQTYDMPIWPADGSIVEFDDYILAKIGAPHYEYTHIEGTQDEFFRQYNSSTGPEHAHPGIFSSNWEIVDGADRKSLTTKICLDSFLNQNGKISSFGWGIIHGVDSRRVTVEIALVGDQHQYMIRSPQTTRKDVTNAFGADGTNYDSCGFSFNGFPTSCMKPGTYQVCVVIKYGTQYKTFIDSNLLVVE